MSDKKLEQLCIDFMNEWDRCSKYPDTDEDLERLDNVYNKMYEIIFGLKSKKKDDNNKGNKNERDN